MSCIYKKLSLNSFQIFHFCGSFFSEFPKVKIKENTFQIDIEVKTATDVHHQIDCRDTSKKFINTLKIFVKLWKFKGVDQNL